MNNDSPIEKEYDVHDSTLDAIAIDNSCKGVILIFKYGFKYKHKYASIKLCNIIKINLQDFERINIISSCSSFSGDESAKRFSNNSGFRKIFLEDDRFNEKEFDNILNLMRKDLCHYVHLSPSYGCVLNCFCESVHFQYFDSRKDAYSLLLDLD